MTRLEPSPLCYGAEPSGPQIRFCRTREGDGHEDVKAPVLPATPAEPLGQVTPQLLTQTLIFST